MLYLTQESDILLAVHPIDFRKQMDGLIGLCREFLSDDPRSGRFFVFINKAHTMIRVLCYEGDGYWLASKRLSRGRYALWPKQGEISHRVLASEMSQILKTWVDLKRRQV